MGMWIGRNRKARVTYGFDEIALVPGEVTINPNDVNTSFEIPRPGDREPLKLKIPIIASAMDGVTNVRFCIEMAKLGGLGVVNLEGVQTRYDNPEDVLAQIAKADKKEGRREEVLPGLSAAERDELSRLRRENKQLRIERDILSKAAAWFARETGAVSSGSSGS